MEFTPFKLNEVLNYSFYQIPKELFINKNYKAKTNSDAKLLYGLLLGRLSLSMKNNWVDKDGNVYLIFTRKEAEETLGLSDKTITKAFNQLKKCNLIYEKKQGTNKPNLIYVGKIEHEEMSNCMTRKNYESGIVESTTLDTEILRGKYKDNKYNNIDNCESKNKTNFEQRVYPNNLLNSFYCNLNFENVNQ